MFDSNTVVAALVFPAGRLSWLIGHWRGKQCIPLVSRETAAELSRVFTYPKFSLNPAERVELLADYLPYCEIVEAIERCPQTCRDTKDRIFLDLAHSGKADVLVTSDKDLLELDSWTAFNIQSPENYRVQVGRDSV